MTTEKAEVRERAQAADGGNESLARSIPNRCKPSGWVRRLLANTTVCAALGTTLGAIIGAASYTPDQTDLVYLSRGEMTAFGAFAGFALGALAGLLLWLARAVIRRFPG